MRATRFTSPLILAALAAITAATGTASADPPGIALNRFDPAERGSDWFSTDSLDLRGSLRPAAGVVVDWAHKPLVLYDADTHEEKKVLVGNQLFVHLGASLVMWNRVRFGLNFPIAALNSGDGGPANGLVLDSGAGIGDLRLGADVRIFGEYGGVFTIAAGAQVYIPTGKQKAFTSDSEARVSPRISMAGDVGIFAYSARLGINIHAMSDDFPNNPIGTELSFGAGVGARLVDGKLLVGPEIYGSTVVSDSNGFFKKESTPFEIIAGGHYKLTDSWRVGLGVGPGLTRGYGTPDIRLLGSVEWVASAEKAPPPAAPSDRDGDGIIDSEDACPDTPGVADADPKKNGCPPDRDGDGIIDSEDACPDEAGVANEDPKKHGCPPPPDTDGDGIVDPEDACPNDPGPANADPKKHGCPKAIVTGNEIRIMERVEFDTGKSTIRKESKDGVLTAVLEILKKYEDIELVSVEGHTDNRGVKYLNLKLSQARASAVVKWLVDNGIDRRRLTAKGFGQEHPLTTNDNEEGRQTNRRVEFIILKRRDQ